MSKRKVKNNGLGIFESGFIVSSCLILCLSFTGCIGLPTMTPAAPNLNMNIPGFYHRVERGQTLWRLSKIYRVDLEEIVRINKITDAANIEINQLIFIPRTQISKTPVSTAAARSENDDFIWPLKGYTITSFGQSFENIINKGLNIKPTGNNTDVFAARGGKVVFYTPNFKNYGKTIIIDHGDGFSTVYTRNSKVFVKAGDIVRKGTVIAKVGSSGSKNKDTYLHFEIRKGYLPQNPCFYLPR